MEKKCIYCKKVLPLSDFYMNRSRPDNHDILCKECRKEANRRSRGSARRLDLASIPTKALIDELRMRGVHSIPDE